MVGRDTVHDTLLVDSGEFSIAKYVDWQNAKYGNLSVRLFAKLHIMHTLHCTVCAATVTHGNASDSPYLRLMAETLPESDGDVLADAAYGGIKNCNAIRDSSQRAIIDSKSNAIIKGFNARAQMLRFREAHPGTFHRILRLRNNVESVFWNDEGAIRRGGARPQTKHPVGGTAVNDHLL